MFRSDPELDRVVGRALREARALGHPRAGSEHLLLALHPENDAVRQAVREAAPLGAGAAADRETLRPLGAEHLVDLVKIDQPPRKEPFFPLGVAKARAKCARMNPPLGLDAQAAYEASLRLALARMERVHRPQHLEIALLALDPGVARVFDRAGIDRVRTLAALVADLPGTRRRWRWRAWLDDIVGRYQHTTGRIVTTHLNALSGL
jgi:hypothetical protein